MPYVDGKTELCKLQSKTQIISGIPLLGAWDVREFVQRRCEAEQGHTVAFEVLEEEFLSILSGFLQDQCQIQPATGQEAHRLRSKPLCPIQF